MTDPANQTEAEPTDPEQLHSDASDALMEADDQIMQAVQLLDRLRTHLSDDKTDPMYVKVDRWYTTLLTRNVISKIVEEMESEDEEPSEDEDPEITIVLPRSRARALRQGCLAAQSRIHDPMTEEEGVLFAEAVDVLELALV